MIFLCARQVLVFYLSHPSALTTGGKDFAAWCELKSHIYGIGMESTLQYGVNRQCLTKAYLWHVCKGPVRWFLTLCLLIACLSRRLNQLFELAWIEHDWLSIIVPFSSGV